MNIFRCIVVLLWGFLFKTKDKSIKTKVSQKSKVKSQKSEVRNQESGISERIKQMEDRNTAILYLV